MSGVKGRSGRPKGSGKKPSGSEEIKPSPEAPVGNGGTPSPTTPAGITPVGNSEEIVFSDKIKGKNKENKKPENKNLPTAPVNTGGVKGLFSNLTKKDKVVIGLTAVVVSIGIAFMFIFRKKDGSTEEAPASSKKSSDFIKRSKP